LNQRPPEENSKKLAELLYGGTSILEYAMKSAFWQIPNMKRYDYKIRNTFLVHRNMAALLAVNLPTIFL